MVPVPPLFGLRGTVPLTFQDKKVKNLVSPAVNRSDLRRINYNKPIFGRDSVQDTAGRAHNALPEPRVGIFPPHYPLLSPRDPRALRFSSELVPLLFRPKLRPWSTVCFVWHYYSFRKQLKTFSFSGDCRPEWLCFRALQFTNRPTLTYLLT